MRVLDFCVGEVQPTLQYGVMSFFAVDRVLTKLALLPKGVSGRTHHWNSYWTLRSDPEQCLKRWVMYDYTD